jgi:hypothetical protein
MPACGDHFVVPPPGVAARGVAPGVAARGVVPACVFFARMPNWPTNSAAQTAKAEPQYKT